MTLCSACGFLGTLEDDTTPGPMRLCNRRLRSHEDGPFWVVCHGLVATLGYQGSVDLLEASRTIDSMGMSWKERGEAVMALRISVAQRLLSGDTCA